jgi:hypothetical protein
MTSLYTFSENSPALGVIKTRPAVLELLYACRWPQRKYTAIALIKNTFASKVSFLNLPRCLFVLNVTKKSFENWQENNGVRFEETKEVSFVHISGKRDVYKNSRGRQTFHLLFWKVVI